MVDLWYVLVASMFAAYVVLDGYDLGVGILQPFVGKSHAERLAVIDTIAPTWDANEVFLVAGGATLYLAFPRLFPAFMSGFYLPIMIVLWLLALRGLGIEMRHKIDHPLWNDLWDGGFFLASLLLVFFFGAALGNIVRGLPVDEKGDFFAPLWTDFTVARDVGILDWYTVLVGVTSVATLAHHGALWLAAKAEGEVRDRATRAAKRLLWAAVVLAAAASYATFRVQPNVLASVRAHPWEGSFLLLAIAGFAGCDFFARRGEPKRAFASSSAAIVGLFGCACVGVHPYGLLARDPSRSVLAADAAADRHALEIGLTWWVPGMVMVVVALFVARRLLAKSSATLAS